MALSNAIKNQFPNRNADELYQKFLDGELYIKYSELDRYKKERIFALFKFKGKYFKYVYDIKYIETRETYLTDIYIITKFLNPIGLYHCNLEKSINNKLKLFKKRRDIRRQRNRF